MICISKKKKTKIIIVKYNKLKDRNHNIIIYIKNILIYF